MEGSAVASGAGTAGTPADRHHRRVHPRMDPISDRSTATQRDAGLPGPWRSEFPITESRAYLCGGGLAPAARGVSDAVGAEFKK